MTFPWYLGSWASCASRRSAGGQLEQPWEVNSSTTAVRSPAFGAAATPEPRRGATTARTRGRAEIFRMVLMQALQERRFLLEAGLHDTAPPAGSALSGRGEKCPPQGA